MANRVLLNANGLKISKPGHNVLTTGSENLLFDSTSKMVQVTHSGIVPNVSADNTPSVSWPALGFTPFVWFYGDSYWPVAMEYLSANSARFRVTTGFGRTSNIYYAISTSRGDNG